MERKSSKEYSVVFLVEGEKVKFTKVYFIFVVGSAANSVGTTLEFAAFRNGPDAKCSRARPSFFLFLSTTMVFAAVRTHFVRKTSASLVDRAAINKQLFKVLKRKLHFTTLQVGLVVSVTALRFNGSENSNYYKNE